ncbi:MAG TPA: hypothetical protein ENN77_00365 [Candidatus Wirthbacteria bacterium]|nr:hypothetical protein [Candidatus Wirthbacteria bacterium]
MRHPSDFTYQQTNRYYAIVNSYALLTWTALAAGLYIVGSWWGWARETLYLVIGCLSFYLWLETLVVTYRFAKKMISDQRILNPQILGSSLKKSRPKLLPLLPSILLIVGLVILTATILVSQPELATQLDLVLLPTQKTLFSLPLWLFLLGGLGSNLLIFFGFLIYLTLAENFLATLDLAYLEQLHCAKIRLQEIPTQLGAKIFYHLRLWGHHLLHLALRPLKYLVDLAGLEMEHVTTSRRLIQKTYLWLFVYLLAFNLANLANYLSIFEQELITPQPYYSILLALLLAPWLIFVLTHKLKKLFREQIELKILLLGLTSFVMFTFYLGWELYQEQQSRQARQIVSFEIQPRDLTIKQGENYRLHILSYDAQNRQILPDYVDWQIESSRPIGTIDEQGIFRASRLGKGQIIARLGEQQASITVTVEINPDQWQSLETEYFKILYRPVFETQLAYLQENLDQMATEVGQAMGVDFPNQKTTLILTETDAEFANVTNLTTDQALAVYYKDKIALGPYIWNSAHDADLESEIEPAYANMVIKHEYTHQIHDSVEKGDLFSNFGMLPLERDLWFVEGLAEYIAFGFDQEAFWDIRDAVIYDYLLDWDDMTGMNVWGFEDYEIYLIYAQGYTIFKHWEITYGQDTMQEFLQIIASGSSPNQAMETVFGQNRSQLEKDWKEWLLDNYADLEYQEFSKISGL